MESVVFYSDAIKVAGDLYVPALAKRTGPVPAVIFCHGWGGTKDAQVGIFAERLNKAGYAVLGFDFRGYGESEGPKDRLFPLEQAQDIAAAAAFLCTDDRIDQNAIAAVGLLTGASSAIVAASWTKAISAVVCFYPFGDGARWLRSMRPYWQWHELLRAADADRKLRALQGTGELIDPDDVFIRDPEGRIGEARSRAVNPVRASWRLGYDSVDALLTFRPEEVLEQVAPRPVMVISPEDDLMMPMEEVDRFVDAVRGPRELLFFKNTGHHEMYQPERLSLTLDEIVKFLDGALVTRAG